jgi:hypothetical protein
VPCVYPICDQRDAANEGREEKKVQDEKGEEGREEEGKERKGEKRKGMKRKGEINPL